MPCATITITDHTKPAQSLATLVNSGNQTGYSILPNASGNPFLAANKVSFLSIQASKGNSSSIIYVGDENTKNDGTVQGQEMAAGDIVIHQASSYGSVHLGELYVRANADNIKVNIDWHYD